MRLFSYEITFSRVKMKVLHLVGGGKKFSHILKQIYRLSNTKLVGMLGEKLEVL